MSRLVAQFDPSVGAGMFNAGAINRCSKLWIMNESANFLQLDFGGAGPVKVIQPWFNKLIALQQPATQVSWTVIATLQSGSAPASVVFVELYDPAEDVSDLLSGSIFRQSNVGNAAAVANATSSVQNDANAPATTFLEATPNDQGSASINETNDGAGYRKILSAGALRTIWNIVRGNATSGKASVQLGDAGDTSITTLYGTVGAGSVVPAATVQGTLPAGQVGSGYPASSLLGSVPSATTAGGVSNGGDADVTAGGSTFRFDTGGTLHFPFGSDIAGISGFGGSGSATVNHGLGQQPRAVCANTLNGSNSTTYGSGSYNGTTCFVYQFNPQPWVAIAYV